MGKKAIAALYDASKVHVVSFVSAKPSAADAGAAPSDPDALGGRKKNLACASLCLPAHSARTGRATV
jgi:hypothetical protein